MKKRVFLRSKKGALPRFFQEPLALGQKGLEQILDDGRRVDLSKTLAAGGSAIFPHTYISLHGNQTASVIHGCLDSGADQVVVLGIIHPITEPLLLSRTKEINGEDISKESCRGILGPGIDRDSCWKNEYSLHMFEVLWNAEVERRGITPPRLIKRYPCLANRSPETLPGIDELRNLVNDSVVVATSDICHHGVAYGLSKEKSMPIGKEALMFAREKIQESLSLLQQERYSEYYECCLRPEAANDSFDVAPVLRYLLGPKNFRIRDIGLSDTSYMYEGDPSPSWVAAALVELN